MKIIHTSDWHLNSVWHGHRRNQDLARSLQQIATYLEDHSVDAMVVSGDLFRERTRPEQMQAGVKMIADHFLPFIQRGGTIIAISGNHDSEIFFEMLNDALKMAPGRKGIHHTDTTGRLYLASKPSVIKLADRDGEVVQFVLMPYPSPRHYLRGEKINFPDIEHRNSAVKEAFKQTFLQLQQRLLDPRLPSVLVSHVYIQGSTTSSGYLPDETNEVTLELSDLPASWAYIALGHIHRPDPVRESAPHIRYAGSIERMDFGEAEEQKSVVLLEIKNRALVGEPRLLSLQSTPFYHLDITDPEMQIPELTTLYPDAQQALMRYVLHWDSLKQPLDQYCQAIEHVFSRCYRLAVKDIRTDIVTEASLEVHHTDDVIGTTRHYLQTRLVDHAERQELLQLMEQLFMEEEMA